MYDWILEAAERWANDAFNEAEVGSRAAEYWTARLWWPTPWQSDHGDGDCPPHPGPQSHCGILGPGQEAHRRLHACFPMVLPMGFPTPRLRSSAG